VRAVRGRLFEYADKRGFRLALIAGANEMEAGNWKIKNLQKREEHTVNAGEVVQTTLRLLDRTE